MATKLIVMSDSHGDRQVVEAIKNHYQGKVDGIFHNGDSELLANDLVWEGIQVVRGNCDIDGSYPNDKVIHFPNVTVAQTHGHLYQINFMWDRLDLFAQEAQADICLYGHLHRADAWQEGKIVFINPGSVSQPRGQVQEKLYALVTVTDKVIRVDFYTLEHKLYPTLSKEFKR